MGAGDVECESHNANKRGGEQVLFVFGSHGCRLFAGSLITGWDGRVIPVMKLFPVSAASRHRTLGQREFI